jgi:capsular polysaccharide biosynthesis protein
MAIGADAVIVTRSLGDERVELVVNRGEESVLLQRQGGRVVHGSATMMADVVELAPNAMVVVAGGGS